MGAAVTKQKALCVATRCTSAQQFIETFHRFCDEQSFFVATMNMRPVGLETPFSIQLQDKSPVLRGLCIVLDAWATAADPSNPYKRPGIRLGIRRLTPESEAVFYQLQAMRTATPQEVVNEASEALLETPVPAMPPMPAVTPSPSVTAMPMPPTSPVRSAPVPSQTPMPSVPRFPRAATPPPIPRQPTPRAGTVSIPLRTSSGPIPVIVDAPPPVTTAPMPAAPMPAAPMASAVPMPAVPMPAAPMPSAAPMPAMPAVPMPAAPMPSAVPTPAMPAVPMPAMPAVPMPDVPRPAVAVPAPMPAAPRPAQHAVVAVSAPVTVAPPATHLGPAAPAVQVLPLVELRTPGSDLILPANPLQDLSDESLVGFVDCTLYEETGNFFRANDDDVPADELAHPPRGPTMPAMPPIDEPALRSITSAFLDDQPGDPGAGDLAGGLPGGPSQLRGRPTTLPPSFSELPIVGPTATGEMVRLGRTMTGEVVPIAREPAEMQPVHGEASVKAQLARVETSMMRLLDHVVDTSRPIDQAPRPLPAHVARRDKRGRTKWIAIGGGAIGLLAIIIVIATRGGDDQPADKPSKPLAMTAAPPQSAKAAPDTKPISDAPKVEVDVDVEREERAAMTAPDTSTSPVVGDGPCRVEVKATPAGTMVQVDGQMMGPSPITIAGPCAKRRIDLVHPRYKAELRWVTPEVSAPSAVDVTLVRPTHSLLVTSQPSGAVVSIAGRRAGTTPTRIPLMGFSVVEVKVEKKGYQAVTKKIYSKRPDDRLSVRLPAGNQLKL